jgi:pentapeptide MXKDX repeat protein
MKKVYVAMFMLACGICALAQNASSSDSMKHDKMAGEKTALTGCIVEKDGKYLLTDEKHPDGVELATSEDLKPHVGHKVRVTGSMGSPMADDKMGKDAMAKDDKMGHASMAKDDKMAHDSMAKDDKMSHDAMAKDDKMGHDSMAMEHGAAMVLNVSKLEMRSSTCALKK